MINNATVPIPPSGDEIAAEIRALIEDGTWPPETKIHTHQQLADRYGVSVSTISRVIAQLRQDGLLIGRGGRGVWVASKVKRR